MKAFFMKHLAVTIIGVAWCAGVFLLAVMLTQPITAQQEPVPPDFNEYQEWANGSNYPSRLRRVYLEAYVRELGILHAHQAVNTNSR